LPLKNRPSADSCRWLLWAIDSGGWSYSYKVTPLRNFLFFSN
jgi:hypothetical protein